MIEVPGVPTLAWTHGPGTARIIDGELELRADAHVDWTVDAVRGLDAAQHNASSLSFAPPDHDFQLSARVTVPEPRSTFDAGALTLWADDAHWAKLCFERSPHGEGMVVSVVTDVFSDDANGPIITGSSVWLRVSRLGEAYAFHYSLDGFTWDFVRQFRWREPRSLFVGFLAQAPFGDGVTATFGEIDFLQASLADVRSGE